MPVLVPAAQQAGVLDSDVGLLETAATGAVGLTAVHGLMGLASFASKSPLTRSLIGGLVGAGIGGIAGSGGDNTTHSFLGAAKGILSGGALGAIGAGFGGRILGKGLGLAGSGIWGTAKRLPKIARAGLKVGGVAARGAAFIGRHPVASVGLTAGVLGGAAAITSEWGGSVNYDTNYTPEDKGFISPTGDFGSPQRMQSRYIAELQASTYGLTQALHRRRH